MKKIVLFLLLTFVSCEIPYDGETIIKLKIKVVNSNNEPLANEKAYIETSYADGSYDFSTYKKTSNAEGLIQFNMFKPTNSATLVLDTSTEYLPVSIHGLDDNNFEGINWNLETLTLFKFEELVSFTVNINQVSTNKVLKSISINGIEYREHIFLNSNYIDFYYEYPTNFMLKKNQNFELLYKTINADTNEIEEFVIPLRINETETNYTIII